MKTMQEVQTLISDLQKFYTDVRLLDAAAIERIEEGVRSNPKAEDLCYACRHRSRRCHHCAVKSAFENHDQRTKLEYFSPDIVQVSAQYVGPIYGGGRSPLCAGTAAADAKRYHRRTR